MFLRAVQSYLDITSSLTSVMLSQHDSIRMGDNVYSNRCNKTSITSINSNIILKVAQKSMIIDLVLSNNKLIRQISF